MTRARPSDINLNEVAHPKVLDAFFREIVRSHPEFANMSRKDLERYLREVLADLAEDLAACFLAPISLGGLRVWKLSLERWEREHKATPKSRPARDMKAVRS